MTTAPLQTAVDISGPPDPDLVRIRDLIYASAGIFHPDNKLGMLLDRCSRRMKEIQAPSLHDYFNCLTAKAAQAEMVALLNEITIGETCFFRNPRQLEALRHILIPKIMAAKTKPNLRSLRIWSAGCSTGEEPYTLSMLLLEEGRLRDWTVEIIATDINENSIAHAKSALYGNYSTRNLPAHFRQKYFTAVGDQLEVQPAVRARVNFNRLNLSDEHRMNLMKNFDVIFCCNVLIYFDLVSKRRVIQHFYSSLLSHGYLFMGHSESLYGVNDTFRLVHLPGATAYVKAEHSPAGRQGA